MSIVYDCIRIVRRVIIHHKVLPLAIEDILFWMFSGFVIFHVMFMVNDGIIRSFSIGGFTNAFVLLSINIVSLVLI